MRPPFALQIATLLLEMYFVESVPIMWAFSASGSGVSCYFLERIRKRLSGTRGDRQLCEGTAVNPGLNQTPWEHQEPKPSFVWLHGRSCSSTEHIQLLSYGETQDNSFLAQAWGGHDLNDKEKGQEVLCRFLFSAIFEGDSSSPNSWQFLSVTSSSALRC